MNIEKQLEIKLDPEFESYEKMEPGSTYGVIKIGNFYEHFYMSPSWWSIDDYLKQWKLAIEKIKSGEKQSCFVVNIQPYTPMMETWVMYRENNTIYFQNKYFIGDYYKEIEKNKSIAPETSFDFIQPRKILNDEGRKILEWKIEL